MTGPIRRALRALALFSGALGVAMCVDGPTSPRTPEAHRASFAFAPVWESSAHNTAAALADAGLPMDRVRIVIIRPVRDTLKDTTVTLHVGDPPITLELNVVAITGEKLDAGLQFKSGETVLFEGTAQVVAQPAGVSGTSAPVDVDVSYVGPGATVTSVVVSPGSGTFLTTSSIQFTARATDVGGTEFPTTPLSWSIADPTFGTITNTGLFTPNGKQGTVVVTAQTPTVVKGTATVTVVRPVASIVIVSGDNQTAAVTQQLALPLVVEVRAADGTGVLGQTVTFAATDGGSIAPISVVTGADGRAQTTLKVGARIGAYSFTAGSGGFSVNAKATATLGAPKKMVLVGPAAFALTSGLPSTGASVVRIVDDGDNGVPNVVVQVDVSVGGATPTATTATSDANGVIALGPFALAQTGVYTIKVSSATLTGGPIIVTATVTSGAATKLGMATLPSASAPSAVAFIVQPQVQLQDANGNPVSQAGVVVTVAITAGGGTLNGTLTATSDASGVATFTNLSLTGLAGGRTLTFSAPNLAPITAATSIGVGAASQMTIVAGNGQTAAVATAVSIAPRVKVVDAGGNPVSGLPIRFAVASGSGSVGGADVLTDVNGEAAATSWVLGVAGGTNSLIATINSAAGEGVTGNPATFTATATGGVAGLSAGISAIGWTDRQAVPAGTTLSKSPSVKIVDANGSGVAGIPILFTISGGNGSVSNRLVVTDNAGVATTEWTLGPVVALNVLTATAMDTSVTGIGFTGTTGSGGALVSASFAGNPVIFNVSGVAGPVAQIIPNVIPADGTAGSLVDPSPSVTVKDARGNPIREATVTFEVTAGNGIVTEPIQTTDFFGVATVGSWTLGGIGTNTLTATVASLPGSPVSFVVTAELPFAAASVSPGSLHTCALTGSGAAYCWGYGAYGQLGDGNSGSSPRPLAMATGLLFQSITAGSYHTCGLAGGSAYCWGQNFAGALGDGTTSQAQTPVTVSGGLTFQSISAGREWTCGLSSGAAYCWGYNPYGQLGDSTTTFSQLSPVRVATALSFQSIAASTGQFTCGLATTGLAYCWGDNTYGQLGIGTPGGIHLAPNVAVGGGRVFQSIAVGAYHACGLTSTGAAYCWGYNQYGEVGDGVGTTPSGVVAVVGGLNFQTISAGAYHTCGVTSGGAAYCWGFNLSGQVGNPSSSYNFAPVAVSGGITFQSVKGGDNHSCGVSSAGTLFCWGSNSSGELGDGSTSYRYVPVAVRRPLP